MLFLPHGKSAPRFCESQPKQNRVGSPIENAAVENKSGSVTLAGSPRKTNNKEGKEACAPGQGYDLERENNTADRKPRIGLPEFVYLFIFYAVVSIGRAY